MKVICANCGSVERDGNPPTSHGICYGCLVETAVHCGFEFEDLLDIDTGDHDLGGEG
jgi:hypothetical protein